MNAGEKGERLALEYLLKRGYTLRAKNYRVGHREIDLILEDREGVIVFVEVKARSSLRYGLPRELCAGGGPELPAGTGAS